LNSKRLLSRSWYYFRVGYSTYLSLPVALLGYASAIYYLAIKNTFLEQFFPHFYYFIIFSLLILPIISVFLGWIHLKRSSLYRAEQDIQVEASPYTTRKVAPVNIPSIKILSQLARQHGIDTTELDKIIEESEK